VRPSRVIAATAPIRICDVGGWTDTWVARRGQVFNIAVQPLVAVQIEIYPRGARGSRVVVHAENYGLTYAPDLEVAEWGPHPLLEGALRSIPPSPGVDVEITIRSHAPPGGSTGTSAAVVVALLAALDFLAGGQRTRQQIADEAHRVETQQLGRQSGVQDQLCAALGGVNFIDIVDYPRAVVSRLALADETARELERRLVLIYLGRPHHSSEVHESVMQSLEQLGADCRPLEALRRAAIDARDAMLAGDFTALGRAMAENTAAQVDLNARLVHGDAWQVADIAAAHGALGWKVNGAGGDGGSITILCGGSAEAKEAMVKAIVHENPSLQSIPVALSSSGVRAWNSG
jgi:D-glycero-alpha-D-manno-heptose-7-phosphate kinase